MSGVTETFKEEASFWIINCWFVWSREEGKGESGFEEAGFGGEGFGEGFGAGFGAGFGDGFATGFGIGLETVFFASGLTSVFYTLITIFGFSNISPSSYFSIISFATASAFC